MPITRCVAYHTLRGGHFDSKSRFLGEETTKDNSGAAVMSVTLTIPNGGQAPPNQLVVFDHSHQLYK
jgi:hypothetical protein